MSNGGQVATGCPPRLTLFLGKKKKAFPPKRMLSLTPLASLGVPRFPLPAKQLCWTHAVTWYEDFPPRQHLLPERCPARLSGLPGRKTSPFFLLFR